MVAENTGNITVSNVEVHDDKEGLGELTYDWKEASGEHLLEPGERVTIHASYKITQEDIEQEKTDNTVIVTGRTPDKKEITPAEATVTTPVERTDSIKIEKTADRALLSNAHVGDRINYTVRVSNTGNTILHEINLQDELKNNADGAACVEAVFLSNVIAGRTSEYVVTNTTMADSTDTTLCQRFILRFTFMNCSTILSMKFIFPLLLSSAAFFSVALPSVCYTERSLSFSFP